MKTGFLYHHVQPKREVVNLEKKPFSFFALGFTVKMKAIGRGCFLFWPYVHFFRRVTHHLRCRITELGTSSTMRDVLMMVERLHRWRGVWFHPYRQGACMGVARNCDNRPPGIHRVTHQELKSTCASATAASSS